MRVGRVCVRVWVGRVDVCVCVVGGWGCRTAGFFRQTWVRKWVLGKTCIGSVGQGLLFQLLPSKDKES